MKIQFYNSLTGKKEEFVPLVAKEAKIYCCGVTVYDLCHLGHARGAINFDVLRAFLKAEGYKVTFVKNYTDIDDKIIARAQESGQPWAALTEAMIEAHDQDMAALGVFPPDIAPKATQHIAEIIHMISDLLAKGFAYAAGGDIFFRVRSFLEYGKLSGKNLDDLISGSRVEVNEVKEDALDFALWKKAKPGEPSWQSPFGEGRPGWHIECSAMAKKYLGTHFDLHLGGSDLIFPHHENEIAQSECCHQEAFVNYWLHNGMVKIDAHKMSKSLGNFFTIRELLEKYHPELIRYFVLSSQYRAAVNFSEEAVERGLEGLDRLYGALFKVEGETGSKPGRLGPQSDVAKAYHQRFMEALADDLNTPMALAVLFEIAKDLNKGELGAEGYWLLHDLSRILGLLEDQPAHWFKSERIKTLKTGDLSNTQIEELIAQRLAARLSKNWAQADQLRDQLSNAGILLIDRDGTTQWQRK